MHKKLLVLSFIIFSFTAYSRICILDVTLSSSGSSICSGTSVVLTTKITGGTGPYNYVWNTGEKTPSISVNKAGTYTVSVSDNTPGCQPITKSITITSLITPNAPTAANQIICPNSYTTLKATAPGGDYQWYDAPVDGTFLKSGDSYITPIITETTTFYVQTTVSGCTSPRTPVTVYVTGKPSVTGATLCAGGVATLSASGGDSYTWYDAASGGNQVGTGPTFVTPVLSSSKTYHVVAIIRGCTSVRTPVTARVTAPPPPPTASDVSTCVGSSASLHADAPDGVFDWFDVPTGGTSLISSPDYTTPPLTATTTYYVQTTINNCQSDRKAVIVTVNPIPQPPPTQTVSICNGTSTTLTADPAPTGTYAWYDQASGGTLLKNGVTFQTPVLTNSTIYYVQHSNGGCTSDRTAVNVNITPPPAAPSVSEPVICSGAVATLTATSAAGGTFQWYNSATGGTLLSSNATYVTPALTGNTTYYVQTTVGGCISARTPATVKVLEPVPAPTVPATSICSGNSAALVASGSPDEYEWYDAATGGNLLTTGSTYVTPVLTSNQTYYVQSIANDCTSLRKAVTVTVNPIPSAPTANDASICPGTSANLTASAASGTIQWYDAPKDGNLLATSNTFSTPVLVKKTTYYVQNTNGSCVSERSAVTVNMISTASPQFKYESGTFCTSGSNPSPAIYVPGGTFSAAPVGLTFVSTSTGQINIAASIPGKYTITYDYGGACPGTSTADITITSTADAQFSYKGPFCTSGPNPLPVFSAGASAGVYSSSPAGLVFKNTSTGEIDLSASKAGTYTVTNTITATAGCQARTSTAQVTIFEAVSVNAGSNQTVPSGTPVKLEATISSGSGIWKGGNGSFSDKTDPHAIYTPRAGETKATLTFTSADPAGPCGPVSSTVTITFNPIPPAPTVTSNPVCIGNSATLVATAPGGTYKWFDAASDGTELFTGPIFKTPPLTTTTTYYVQVTKSGITSSRKAVTVNITPTPAAPQVDISPACAGGTATLTASGSTGTYKWYDAPIGGTLLETKAVYVTPVLNADKSYYVQTTVNGCTSPRTQVDVKVSQAPHVTSAATGIICSGTPLDYTITADIPATTFSWSRAAVAGISNPAATAETDGPINEPLMNTLSTPVNVKYIITPVANGCTGPAFTYQVTVNPLPVVSSDATAIICNGTTDGYEIKFDNSGASVTWSRAAVDGISNAAVSGQTAPVIKEVLFNTSTAPVDATYVFNYKTSNCQGPPFSLVMKVNPAVKITSDVIGTVCSGIPQNYTITSNIPSATFSWKRDAVTNISNPAVSDQTNAVIDEKLINTGPVAVKVTYIITAQAFGCTSTPFTYVVTVNPQADAPVANSNTPVCEGSTIQLRTPTIPRATYKWTGPNGYVSELQNPDIPNVTAANGGTYNLYVITNDCTSPATSIDVQVNEPPKADAGPDQTQCITSTAIKLAGSVTGGTSTGIWSVTSGTGKFFPSSDQLDAQYIPSAEDKAAGSVKLTLSSTSKDDCAISTSDMTVTFAPSPAADAGADLNVCAQDESIKLSGRILIPGGALWSNKTGSGTFSPSATQPDAFYIPSAADIQSGSVTLILTATAAGICDIPTDEMTIKFTPPPTLNAGGTRYVLKDRTITLTPTVSDENVQYLWSPAAGLSSTTIKNPVLTGDVDRTYTLQITDSRGCVSTDKTFIKVSPQLIVPNTFTPNGDGSNDFWDIRGLIAYENAVVDIFNRYGQQLFHSIGYSKPWEGTYNGQPVPAGTYYYKINTNVNNQVLSGYVLIIR
ncbi:Ig-like domain-containing protein [Mucilaginibacter pocheonensis]|uniref:Gliding motility-associated-like protein n=1 Tax=Mucilaginibacter pocheonensis TaxID=398050 RepID=A0ABU1T907_9SPHI|nr:PKD-like domain-containing protein [Mucilaginibacter pocheonensis]MDR6941875.1 gliding motility-associated-like protein [Mucilaginibacter pocheonensis]